MESMKKVVFCIIFLILGALLCLIAIGLLLKYSSIIKRGKRMMGQICKIGEPSFPGKGGKRYSVWIRLEGSEIEIASLSGFLVFYFQEKRRLKKLQQKYIGKRVHVYFDCDKKAVLIQGMVWKDILTALWTFLLGILIIFISVLLLVQ